MPATTKKEKETEPAAPAEATVIDVKPNGKTEIMKRGKSAPMVSSDPTKNICGFGDMQDMSDAGFEVIQTGGTTKWVKFEAGDALHGVLMDMQLLPDDEEESGSRRYYNFRLKSPCRVTYKDPDSGAKMEDMAQPGEIVACGERSKLMWLAEAAASGAIVEYVLQAHTQIPIGKGRKMWTFNVGRKVIKEAPTVQLVHKSAAPF